MASRRAPGSGARTGCTTRARSGTWTSSPSSRLSCAVGRWARRTMLPMQPPERWSGRSRCRSRSEATTMPDWLLWMLGWAGLVLLAHTSTRNVGDSAVDLIVEKGARVQHLPPVTRRRFAVAAIWAVDVLVATLAAAVLFLAWISR